MIRAIPLLMIPAAAFAPSHTGKPASIKDLIYLEARRDHVPGRLCLEIAQRESHLNPDSRHVNLDGTTDRGLFQLNSAYFPLDDESDPLENIRVGVARLAECWRLAGHDWEQTKCLYAHPANCDSE